MNRGAYSADGQIGTVADQYGEDTNQTAFPAALFMGGVPQSELNWSLQYLGVNLSKDATQNYVGNGIQVGRQPVILTLDRQRTAEDFAAIRVLVWAEVERMMLIKSGNIFMSGQ